MEGYFKQLINRLQKSPLAPLLQRGKSSSLPLKKGELERDFYRGNTGGFLLNRPKNYLISANILLVFLLILLNNLNVLPVKNFGDFIFFAILALAFALYRPGWAFLFFIGTIALENINLAPESMGINIRPYQFIGGLTILAVVIRFVFKRLNFKLPKWNWADGLLLFFSAAGFLSALASNGIGSSVKQSVIVVSFVALYFLVRIFVQSADDLKKIIPFYLSSAAVIILYGIWQNIRFAKGLPHFEIMPGRPNSVFVEPDWLGIYLALILAVIYSVIYYFNKKSENIESVISNNQFPISKKFPITNFQFPKNLFLVFCFLFLVATNILLILTVSRSAWLGAAAVSILFVVFSFWEFVLRNRKWKEFFQQLLFLAIAIIGSLAVVNIFNLTSFQLFNRAQSTGTGLQEITIACPGNMDIAIPKTIQTEGEYTRYGCRHINLEEIDAEKSAGNAITEVYRPDPNVDIRKIIYQKSWVEIKKHPFLGIGWGNIGKILGKTDKGEGLSANDTQFQAELNSSNIFLEVWLGSGLVGFLCFIIFYFYILISSGINFFRSSDWLQKSVFLFIILGWAGLTAFNLFNAGIFLGFFWAYLAIGQIKYVNWN